MQPELLEQAIAAHGELERWRSAAQIRVRLRVAGWAFVAKWQRGALADVTATVSTREPKVTMEPFAGVGNRGVFERDTVTIESTSGQVVARRSDPRAQYGKLRRKLWWDDLDLLHFAGYALWGYVNAPFMFTDPGYELREVEPWFEHGEAWRGLEVRFPEEVPAHSRLQRFYFDERGLLRRNDYTAEVFGGWARAAHYIYEHREMDGLMVPTRRKALTRKRNGKPRPRITVVSIAIDEFELQR